MLVLMLMSMLMPYASVDFFVLSFVLSCAYVTSEDQVLLLCIPLFLQYKLHTVFGSYLVRIRCRHTMGFFLSKSRMIFWILFSTCLHGWQISK